ncbi:uncharacterized protein VTP21DRAFT_4042 [Calcarisporiella thermophila]|uniref:uncharacterized protein n=1 Tax=Calcarisporiella thermophila TaxID=911321 RepID=UPI003744035F
MHHLNLANFPTLEMLRMLACCLERITKANDQLLKPLSSSTAVAGSGAPESPTRALSTREGDESWVHPNYTRFHARSLPAIDIHAYLVRILKYCPCPNECFLSLLVYFDRMARYTVQKTGHPFTINSYNIHRLIISGVVIASKYFSDVFYTNSRYAKVGGLPVHELNILEREFLVLCEFHLAVPIEELQNYGDQLLRHWLAEEEHRRNHLSNYPGELLATPPSERSGSPGKQAPVSPTRSKQANNGAGGSWSGNAGGNAAESANGGKNGVSPHYRARGEHKAMMPHQQLQPSHHSPSADRTTPSPPMMRTPPHYTSPRSQPQPLHSQFGITTARTPEVIVVIDSPEQLQQRSQLYSNPPPHPPLPAVNLVSQVEQPSIYVPMVRPPPPPVHPPHYRPHLPPPTPTEVYHSAYTHPAICHAPAEPLHCDGLRGGLPRNGSVAPPEIPAHPPASILTPPPTIASADQKFRATESASGPKADTSSGSEEEKPGAAVDAQATPSIMPPQRNASLSARSYPQPAPPLSYSPQPGIPYHLQQQQQQQPPFQQHHYYSSASAIQEGLAPAVAMQVSIPMPPPGGGCMFPSLVTNQPGMKPINGHVES